MDGSISGEILYYFPRETIKKILDKMMPSQMGKKLLKKTLHDAANELGNMITGTFVNQMQYLNHEIFVSPPEVQEQREEYMRTLFETVNLSFDCELGGFDIDFFYKENS
jgi:CheY-specific phosphatase CheX